MRLAKAQFHRLRMRLAASFATQPPESSAWRALLWGQVWIGHSGFLTTRADSGSALILGTCQHSVDEN